MPNNGHTDPMTDTQAEREAQAHLYERHAEVANIAREIIKRIHATSDILCANNGEVDEDTDMAVFDCIRDVLMPSWRDLPPRF